MKWPKTSILLLPLLILILTGCSGAEKEVETTPSDLPPGSTEKPPDLIPTDLETSAPPDDVIPGEEPGEFEIHMPPLIGIPFIDIETETVAPITPTVTGIIPLVLSPWEMVSTGAYHTCAISPVGGKIYCWGQNRDGQLGNGKSGYIITGTPEGGEERIDQFEAVPTSISDVDDKEWSFVSAGQWHTCAVKKADGALYCWGSNYSGQLGNGSSGEEEQAQPVPVDISHNYNWSMVSGGGWHTCAIKTEGMWTYGKLYCWGLNNKGQLGVGNLEDEISPTQVGLDSDWLYVAASKYHTCGIKADGKLLCWGVYADGRLGLGGLPDDPGAVEYMYTYTGIGRPVVVVPTEVEFTFPNTWKKVVLGEKHTCGIKTNDTLWCWGDNEYNQLGLEQPPYRKHTPAQVKDYTTWQSVAAGMYFTCGVMKDGSIWCWGFNTWGQHGDGTYQKKETPTKIEIGSDWASISTGNSYTCAMQIIGNLFCWGENSRGQLGDGTKERRLRPVMVLNPDIE